MKKIFFIVIALTVMVTVAGCGTSQLATKISVEIGKGFIASAGLGVPEMKKAIKAWPYISGQIQSIPNIKAIMPPMAQDVINELDAFAEQTEWTDRECGQISTDLIAIEKFAIEAGLDSRYGISVMAWIKSALGMGA